jgi:hypothetical protein
VTPVQTANAISVPEMDCAFFKRNLVDHEIDTTQCSTSCGRAWLQYNLPNIVEDVGDGDRANRWHDTGEHHVIAEGSKGWEAVSMAECIEELSPAEDIGHEGHINGTRVGRWMRIRSVAFEGISKHVHEFPQTHTVSKTNRQKLFELGNVRLGDRERQTAVIGQLADIVSEFLGQTHTLK